MSFSPLCLVRISSNFCIIYVKIEENQHFSNYTKPYLNVLITSPQTETMHIMQQNKLTLVATILASSDYPQVVWGSSPPSPASEWFWIHEYQQLFQLSHPMHIAWSDVPFWARYLGENQIVSTWSKALSRGGGDYLYYLHMYMCYVPGIKYNNTDLAFHELTATFIWQCTTQSRITIVAWALRRRVTYLVEL